MISADFSGQELRLLAEVSQEPKFIEALKENKDLHSYSASLVFDIPYEDFFEKDEKGEIIIEDGEPKIKPEMKKKYRTPCKSLTFGLVYGMGVQKLARQLDIPLNEAKEIREKYFSAFPKIKECMDKLVEDLKENKYALSPLDKRRRNYFHIDWDHPGRVAGATNAAKNLPFQGCGASTIKLAMCRIKRRMDKEGTWDARLCIVVHDELVYEVCENQAEDFAKLVEEEMVKAFNMYAPNVPMTAKAIIANHWVH